jgi:hypothetical protein
MPSVLTIETNTLMPPFGVATALAPVDGTELFLFWLQTHTDPLGAKFWRTAVLRECLPDPDGELMFVAMSPIVRHQPRTALVRVAL